MQDAVGPGQNAGAGRLPWPPAWHSQRAFTGIPDPLGTGVMPVWSGNGPLVLPELQVPAQGFLCEDGLVHNAGLQAGFIGFAKK